ncbi:MAG: hypothetical protein JOY92_07350 [Verrucomicrobia bacterium]|nr:hypothetical protein [Verrucomicrobiota bacterium]
MPMSLLTPPDPNKIYINGINGATGEYLVPPVDPADVPAILKKEADERPVPDHVTQKADQVTNQVFVLPMDVVPEDPGSAGWGIVFIEGEDGSVRDALRPLIEHRKTRYGTDKVKELDYKPGESWSQWLGRRGVTPGQVNPDLLPYYLLLVGSPEKIPYTFQYLLELDYAVGRLAFDSAADYAAYAKSTVEYETAASMAAAKSIALFGTHHDFDPATALSAENLITPLAQGYPGPGGAQRPPIGSKDGYSSQAFIGDNATKANLRRLLHDPNAGRPSFLFTATHGLGWPKGDLRQLPAQGALLCQDWPGSGPPRPEHYFAAADVQDDACLSGMICFHFACFGGGTPQKDDFPLELGVAAPDLAPAPFVAALPKRLLSHPRGGALAVIGHIERAWGYSIPVTQVGPRLLPFENAVRRMLKGQPAGHATKDFNELFATRSASLTEMLQQVRNGFNVSDRQLVSAWIERNDARNYAVIGDPAACLRV